MQRGSEETLLTGKKCVKSFPILKDNYLANPHISISNIFLPNGTGHIISKKFPHK